MDFILDKAAGDRATYHITEDSIIIKDGPYDFIYFAKDYKEDKVIFSLKVDSAQKETLSKIG